MRRLTFWLGVTAPFVALLAFLAIVGGAVHAGSWSRRNLTEGIVQEYGTNTGTMFVVVSPGEPWRLEQMHYRAEGANTDTLMVIQVPNLGLADEYATPLDSIDLGAEGIVGNGATGYSTRWDLPWLLNQDDGVQFYCQNAKGNTWHLQVLYWVYE